MQGLHLTSDLSGCDPARAVMTDPDALRRLCLAAVARAGLQAVGELFHRFDPQPGTDPALAGVTGVVLLAESHLALHTWPEQQGVTLDVYVCNMGQDNSARAQGLMQALCEAFGARQVRAQALQRGLP
jgi:S-adenosylmethionine decarboxylase